jgi:hypothetical protein
MKAEQIAKRAAELVSGERAQKHGDSKRNMMNIAALWNAYLKIRRDPLSDLTGVDVCHLMALLKVARTQSGELHPDDWIDSVGYLIIAGDLAEME